MDMSSMKNMIVLKNLPSNLIEEAIVILKENKKVKKYQYIESKKNKKEDRQDENKRVENNDDYIVKEAENVINHYITNLEMKSPKWKNDIRKLEKRYKQSIKLNFTLGAMAIIGIVLSLV